MVWPGQALTLQTINQSVEFNGAYTSAGILKLVLPRTGAVKISLRITILKINTVTVSADRLLLKIQPV
jgi:hypothetical protein